MNKTGDWRMATTLCGIMAVLWSCVQVARADYAYGEATEIPNVSMPGAGSPYISPDGLELYFTYTTEDGCRDLWVTKRATTKQSWGTPVPLDAPVNSPGPVGGVCISADGLELYFGENNPFLRPAACVANPDGYGGGDLWVSKRATKTDPWGTPQNLGPAVNSTGWDDHPHISADGLFLYFASDRSGTTTLWVTTRAAKNASWGPPAKLGFPIDMASFETTPFVSPDGLSLYFAEGDFSADIYVSRRTTTADPWGTPVPFTPVNSAQGEWHLSFSAEDSTLYFDRAAFVNSRYYDLWQVKMLPIVDFNRDGTADDLDMALLMDNWGRDVSLYDIGPTSWGDHTVDIQDLRVFLRETTGLEPNEIYPPDHAAKVPCDVVLNWISPSVAPACDVYLGTSFDVVNNADRADPCAVLVSQGQTATTYDPEGLLEFGRTYYWRVDFVRTGQSPATYKGAVWQFTTETSIYPVQNITATASGFAPGLGPEKTVDGSGLDGNDLHSSNSTDMWRTSSRTMPPRWIRYTFDKVHRIHEMWVWNFNAPDEPVSGFGAKTVKIEYSADGTTWTLLDGVPEFAQAPGQNGYAANTKVKFGGVSARFVKLTITETWGGKATTGLSEVRFYALSAAVAAEP